MTQFPPHASGQFRIGGDLTINRLGFGAMRITGEGIWGEPADRAAALATLRKARDLGIDFIDTADSYGPFVSEDLIREALHPYDRLVIATKGALTRHGPNIWRVLGRPEYLRQCVLMSLRRLKVDRIDLWQLAPHRSRRAARRAVRGDGRHAEGRADPPSRAERGQRRGDRGRREGVQGRRPCRTSTIS